MTPEQEREIVQHLVQRFDEFKRWRTQRDAAIDDAWAEHRAAQASRQANGQDRADQLIAAPHSVTDIP